jgi:DNA-nicking Smr family endonuclease
MDFGDILDQWDKQAAVQAKHKTTKEKGEASSLPDDPEEKKADPVDVWMRKNGVYDKDAEDGELFDASETSGHVRDISPQEAAKRRRRLRVKHPDAALDLHGLNRDDAWNSLDTFFNDGKQQGFEKLLVIHGKGNHTAGEAVLERTVRDFIERCPFAGESGHGDASSGGSGATWVLLKDTMRHGNGALAD